VTFRILTVCTGNICRSPQAEQLLRTALADTDADVEISSAGTSAMVGYEMPQQASALSREFGGEPSGHEPRQLTKQIVEQADLILTMAREHRSAVAKLSPAASRRTFTLREFARAIAPTEDAERPTPNDWPAWVALAAARRGYVAAGPEDDDVVDPFRRSEATYRRSIEQIAPAVESISAAVAAR
jgi:protein-tyrosine phosphatase